MRSNKSNGFFMKLQIASEDADLFDGFGNGSLHLFLTQDPTKCRGVDRPEEFYLELDFHLSDWQALFIGILDVPDYDRYVEGDDISELHERNRKKFEQSIPDYPMLSRLFDMYEDYKFAPNELPKLREECERLKLRTTNTEGLKALRKLIFAADQASQRGFHLMFICD